MINDFLNSDFWLTYGEPGVWMVAGIVAMMAAVIVAVAYLTYAERKVLAAMQRRQGPMMVGPFGLLQPIADGMKLLSKETIIPSQANKPVFILAPILLFTLALVAWSVIPVSGKLSSPISMSACCSCSRFRRWVFTGSLWRAGRRTRAMPSSVRCVRRRRWCHMKCRWVW